MYIPELCTARLSEQSASPCQQCPPEGEPAASGRSVSGPQAGPPATSERERRREKIGLRGVSHIVFLYYLHNNNA